MNPLSRCFVVALSLSLGTGLVSCQNFADAVANVSSTTTLGSTYDQSRGLLPVRANPPSVAYRRLNARANLSPSLKMYLQAKGYPDYMVEDDGSHNSSIVCFHVAKNEAYLLKITEWQYDKVKIIGPAPIGEKDKRLFKAMKELEKAASAYSEPEDKPTP